MCNRNVKQKFEKIISCAVEEKMDGVAAEKRVCYTVIMKRREDGLCGIVQSVLILTIH